MSLHRTAAVVGASLIVVVGVPLVEAVVASRRSYLSAESAPAIGGEFGRAFAPPLRLAVLGDSTGAGVGVSAVEDSVAGMLARVVADGGRFVTLDGVAVAGSRASDLGPQVSRALVHRPDIAVILVGANDATHGTDLGAVRHDLGDAVRRLRSAGVAVVVGTCPDMGAGTAFAQPLRSILAWQGRRVAAAEREAVEEAGGVAVDIGAETGPEFRRDRARYFARDRFHPSADGYRLWADALAPAVRASVRSTTPT